MRSPIVGWVLPLLLLVAGPASAGPRLHQLLSVEMGTPQADLGFLPPLLAGKTVIGLGEATHGSHEIFAVKGRLVEFLVSRGLVGTVAFEMDYADGLALDGYVTGRSRSDVRAILKSTQTFSIANADVLHVIERLHAINAQRPEKQQVHIFGYDVQTPGHEAAMISDWLKRIGFADRIALGEHLTKLVGHKDLPIQRFSPSSAAGIKSDLALLEAALESHRASLETASAPGEFAEMRQAATVIGQSFDLFSAPGMEAAYDQRDADGAANILDRQTPDGRTILVWAHNGHVDKGSYEFKGARLLGGRLADIIGPKYYAIATAFDEGDAMAFHAKDGLIANHLPPARDGSIDATLNAAGPDIYFADFGQVRGDPGWRDLLAGMNVMRGVGADYEPENDSRTYRPTKLGDQFDAVLFVRRLTASRPL